jgi:hypothetical protein
MALGAGFCEAAAASNPRIHTMPEKGNSENDAAHPPLKGEGKERFSAAEGSPGWGGGAAARDTDAGFAARPSPPPGPLARADLPPAEPSL